MDLRERVRLVRHVRELRLVRRRAASRTARTSTGRRRCRSRPSRAPAGGPTRASEIAASRPRRPPARDEAAPPATAASLRSCWRSSRRSHSNPLPGHRSRSLLVARRADHEHHLGGLVARRSTPGGASSSGSGRCRRRRARGSRCRAARARRPSTTSRSSSESPCVYGSSPVEPPGSKRATTTSSEWNGLGVSSAFAAEARPRRRTRAPRGAARAAAATCVREQVGDLDPERGRRAAAAWRSSRSSGRARAG